MPLSEPRHEFTYLHADDYHRDPCQTPSLSASIAHVLETQSPLHAYSRHPRLGGQPGRQSKAFDHGALSHALLLGRGKEIAVIEADDWRTKAAREARDGARELNQIPVLADEYKAALETATALRARFADLGIVLDGQSEMGAFWTETAENGHGVQCRGMMDHVSLPRVYDLKSCQSAHPKACQRHADSYGYAIQRAAYVRALERLFPRFAGRIEFVFVFYELAEPYAVTPVRLSGGFRELGEKRWLRAVNTWEACLRENHWPAYVSHVIDLEPPAWALVAEMNRETSAADWAAE